MQDFDKLGVLYLGRPYDLATKQGGPGPLLYDSKDLVTHAVCVGMTGSGKTGLCIGLLEEAALDGIPALIIDPKGDLPNLLLTFPELRPEDFRPWINEDDATRKGLSPDDFARQQADLWTKGLAGWGQDGERIRRLRAAADFSVYTPGSNAGMPVSILKSFAAPAPAVREDTELMRDRISTAATSLLALLGIEADPLQSREHILLSNIFSSAWQAGVDLDLPGLIRQIQSPPFERVGVLGLEDFFPPKDRFGLAMLLNNLLAAPGFELWLEGEPLDIGRMLHTAEGKPRHTIFSIAHLGDAERMFFVSLLLNEVLGWVRTQPGTSSLRALLYMDEMFGYFPPVANPPSKLPLLTLLKQARAYGLGVVLATQNPVDLDYKGLANTGTWFIGRLQTERDKARLLEGLEGAAAGAAGTFDRSATEQIIAGLGNRVFLMNNVHEDAPEVFETRWTMSYLRGPLTRNQIKMLMAERKGHGGAGWPPPPVPGIPGLPRRRRRPGRPVAAASAAASPPAAAFGAASGERPLLPPDLPQYFVPRRSQAPAGARLVFSPRVVGSALVRFTESKLAVDLTQPVVVAAVPGEGPVPLDWEAASPLEVALEDLEAQPSEEGAYDPLPAPAGEPKRYAGWGRDLALWLYRSQSLPLLSSPGLELVSAPGEDEREFRIRVQQAARESRDEWADKLRQKYATRTATLEERLRKAQQAVEREADQARDQKTQTAVSFGATLLGAFLGRKKISMSSLGRATTAVRGVSRSARAQEDVGRAKETVATLQQQLADSRPSSRPRPTPWRVGRARWPSSSSRWSSNRRRRGSRSAWWRWCGCPTGETSAASTHRPGRREEDHGHAESRRARHRGAGMVGGGPDPSLASHVPGTARGGGGAGRDGALRGGACTHQRRGEAGGGASSQGGHLQGRGGWIREGQRRIVRVDLHRGPGEPSASTSVSATWAKRWCWRPRASDWTRAGWEASSTPGAPPLRSIWRKASASTPCRHWAWCPRRRRRERR